MMKKKREPKDRVEAFERAVKESDSRLYVLRLYITGATAKSMHAIENIRRICKQHLQGRYDLEVIDIYQYPKLAKGEQIVALPTLIKKLPLPLRRLVGDLSDTENVLFGLDLKSEE
jgi:circadian clock protein KaiB